MSQRLLLPAFLVTVLLGCFGSHGSGGGDADGGVASDARTRDATFPPDIPCDCFCGAFTLPCMPGGTCIDVCPDAGPRPDACIERAADLLCDYSHVTANTPTTIPIAIDGCFCEGFARCTATIGSDRILDLSTSDCSNPDVDCDDCVPFLEGSCELPPLDAGTWQVNVNGRPSFDLNVVPEDVLPERGSTCLRRAEHAEDSCGIGWPASSFMPGTTCHPTHARPGDRVAINVSHSCGTCGEYRGPCQVDVFDDVIRVRPSSMFTLCDIDCPAICMPRDDTCWTPRLEEGTWRVFIDGLDYESTIEVGPDAETTEVCGPFFPHG